MNKKIIYVIILFIIIFFMNLLLYVFSEDYRNFIKSFKSNENTVIDEYNLDNKKNNLNKNFSFSEDEEKLGEKKIEKYVKEMNKLKNKTDEKMKGDKLKKFANDYLGEKDFKKGLGEKTISYSKKQKVYIDTIKWFFKGYKLKKNYDKDIIFNLTTEFPSERYIEYSSSNLALYFFINSDYEKILEIFDVLSYEDGFKINKVDNFGKKSFYMNRDIDDGYIRLVIEYNNFTFGLMVKNKYYENIKSILYTKLR